MNTMRCDLSCSSLCEGPCENMKPKPMTREQKLDNAARELEKIEIDYPAHIKLGVGTGKVGLVRKIIARIITAYEASLADAQNTANNTAEVAKGEPGYAVRFGDFEVYFNEHGNLEVYDYSRRHNLTVKPKSGNAIEISNKNHEIGGRDGSI